MTQISFLARRAALVDQFVRITTDQHDTLLLVQNAKFNRLVWQMKDVLDELRSMPGDQRVALLPLLSAENLWVRYRAAQAVLALEPALARQAIESVSDTNIQPEAGEAASTLGNLDSGIFVPT